MPLISIIIPTYNSEKTISESIKSILEQSFDNYEILIMDGISGDNTLNIVKEFNDPRIKIFSEKDSGVYDAMNKGIEKAEGKWLYFLGSDDTLYDKETLKDIEPFLGNHDLVYGDAYFTFSKTFYGEEKSISSLIKGKNICHQAIFYQKDIFKKVGFYNLKYPIWADLDFNIRCFINPSIKTYYIKKTIANYNDLNGISSEADQTFIEDFNIFREFLSIEIIEKRAINKFKKSSDEFTVGDILLRKFKPTHWLLNLYKKSKQKN